jgi:hypothetical protein
VAVGGAYCRSSWTTVYRRHATQTLLGEGKAIDTPYQGMNAINRSLLRTA